MSDHMGAPRAARAGDAADREAVEQAGVNGLIAALFRCADENPRPAVLIRHAAHEIGFLDSTLRAQAERVAALETSVRELEQEREAFAEGLAPDEAEALRQANDALAAHEPRSSDDVRRIRKTIAHLLGALAQTRAEYERLSEAAIEQNRELADACGERDRLRGDLLAARAAAERSEGERAAHEAGAALEREERLRQIVGGHRDDERARHRKTRELLAGVLGVEVDSEAYDEATDALRASVPAAADGEVRS